MRGSEGGKMDEVEVTLAPEEESAHLFFLMNRGEPDRKYGTKTARKGSHLSLQHLPPTPEMVEKVDLVNEPA